MSHRLFVGIDLPDSIRNSMHLLQCGLKNARWVAPENLHLTLRFIGEVDRAQADEIDQALMTVDAPPIEIELGDAGAFGAGDRALILWAGVARTPALIDLKLRVDAALGHVGIAPDGRKFAPHITLARFNNAPARLVSRRAAEIAPAVAGRFTATAFILFESRLGSSGAHYERAALYPLIAT
jgi:2'-5' RNA ligase